MKLTVVFSRHSNWWAIGSKFICWAQGTPFSHVALMIDNEFGTEPIIFEAVYPRSRKIKLMDWLALGNEQVVSFELKVTDEAALRRVLYEYLDKEYSVLALAEQGLAIIFKGLKHKFDKLSWASKNFLICTEYAQRVLSSLYGVDRPGMSLRDVYRECRRINQSSI